MNRLVLAFFIYSGLGLVAIPAYGRFVVMQDELWATNAAIHASISSGDIALSNQVDVVSGLIAVETASRAAGDSLGSNHVHSVELALSNRLDSVELALTGTSNDLAQAISAETQSRIAEDATNHNEIVGVQEYAEAVSNKFDSAVHALETNLHTKVSTNHFGDVTIHGGIVVTDNIYMGEGKNLVLTNELDPYWSAVSNDVTQNAIQGAMAHGWGDHSVAGYLTNESDPYWSSVSNRVTQNAVKGSIAYGWGDHSLMGYLTTFVEQDGVALPRVSALESRTNYWNQAFGWGDHSLVGYLTNELDPSWSAVSNIVTQNAVQGATAYGWGDHSTIGYLTYEIDPYWSAVSNTVIQKAGQGAMAYSWGDHAAIGYLTSELDPVWTGVSDQYSKTIDLNISNWDAAYGWGDHSIVGYLTNEADPYWSAVSNNVTQNAVKGATAYDWGDHAAIGYLTDEIDPYWSAVSNAVTQNAVKGSTAFGWGDHSIIGYLTTELDPYWSAVSNIVTQNAVQGATAYGWGDHELVGYANTNGSIYVGGNVTATSFIGDGSQLSGVSGGVEFPELTIYSSGATTSIPFTKDYKYYQVVVTNSTDVSFDYTGIGDFTGSVLEFQIRLVLVNPLVDAVTIPADGVDGIKYVGDIDISATQANTVQHLGMMMYYTNKVLLSHWFFDEP